MKDQPAVHPTTRECSAIGCTIRIKRSLFMCLDHWYSLTPKLRTNLWAAKRRWRLGGPQDDFILASKQAQLHIAWAEGRMEDVATLNQTVDKLKARQRKANNEATI